MSRHQPYRVGRRFPAAQTQAESLAGVIEQLCAVFDGELPPTTVVAVVRRTRRELETSLGPPSPHAVEQLARARLRRLVDTGPAVASPDTDHSQPDSRCGAGGGVARTSQSESRRLTTGA